MKIRTIVGLLLTLLAVSACLVEPIGGRGYHRGHERGAWRG